MLRSPLTSDAPPVSNARSNASGLVRTKLLGAAAVVSNVMANRARASVRQSRSASSTSSCMASCQARYDWPRRRNRGFSLQAGLAKRQSFGA